MIVRYVTNFVLESGRQVDSIEGNVVLSPKEVITLHRHSAIISYIVLGKKTECYLDEAIKVVETTYVLEKHEL